MDLEEEAFWRANCARTYFWSQEDAAGAINGTLFEKHWTEWICVSVADLYLNSSGSEDLPGAWFPHEWAEKKFVCLVHLCKDTPYCNVAYAYFFLQALLYFEELSCRGWSDTLPIIVLSHAN